MARLSVCESPKIGDYGHQSVKRRKFATGPNDILPAPATCDLSAALQRKVPNARDQLLTFADPPGRVAPTNNPCERALRPAVIQRKVTNGYRSRWAAEGDADIRTVVDTAGHKNPSNRFETILQTVSA